MKLIIAGSRNLNPRPELLSGVVREFEELIGEKVTEVVSGCAAGIDAAGEAWASANGVPVKRFPADWGANGKAAGPIRNRQMAEYADALLAVWDGKSRGTANMIREAEKRGLITMQIELEFGPEGPKQRAES